LICQRVTLGGQAGDLGQRSRSRDLHPEPQSERLSEFPQAAHDFGRLGLPAFEALHILLHPLHVFL
jgi:hypothetical protein